MSFQVKILLLSFAATVVISLVVIPTLRKLKVGQSEREDGPESHLSKKGTPTMRWYNFNNCYFNFKRSFVYRLFSR